MNGVPQLQSIPTNDVKEFIGSVSPKGMITIPHEARKLFKIKPKGNVVIRVSKQTIEVKPLPMTLEEVMGSVPPLDPPKSWKQIRQEKHDEYAERYLNKIQS